jgi:hypothetical protein
MNHRLMAIIGAIVIAGCGVDRPSGASSPTTGETAPKSVKALREGARSTDKNVQKNAADETVKRFVNTKESAP